MRNFPCPSPSLVIWQVTLLLSTQFSPSPKSVQDTSRNRTWNCHHHCLDPPGAMGASHICRSAFTSWVAHRTSPNWNKMKSDEIRVILRQDSPNQSWSLSLSLSYSAFHPWRQATGSWRSTASLLFMISSRSSAMPWQGRCEDSDGTSSNVRYIWVNDLSSPA